MDKYEYKVRADEIKSLIAEGEYARAVKIADTIDWRRVKSVMMLCTISDLYKINRRYEDSRDILLLAYEKHTGGRLIVYSLCELSIKLGEYVQALEYYKEFAQLAPKDSSRYILQYKLYEAQEVSLEERIEVLEEFKKRDYREKWAYELAYLYHRVGLASKCVEECNEIFLWFGEGRYVLKALELKMLHEPLTPEQQDKYEQLRKGRGLVVSDYTADQEVFREETEAETEEEEDNEFSLEENMLTEDTTEVFPAENNSKGNSSAKFSSEEISAQDMDIEVKTVDVSQYNTINLQKELAESMREFLEDHKTQQLPVEEVNEALKTKVFEPVSGLDSPEREYRQDTDEMQLISEADLGGEPEEMLIPGMQENSSEEVFFGNTQEVNIQDVVSELVEKNGINTPFAPIKTMELQESYPEAEQEAPVETSPPVPMASPDPAISNTGVIRTFHKPSGYDHILSQEYDGQISLVMPEQEKIEKQITGQLSIDDVMAEWERIKQENERKRMEEIKKRVHQQTDALFADFDESTKSGLLEKLENAMVTAAMKEEREKIKRERPKVVKVADIDAESPEETESVIPSESGEIEEEQIISALEEELSEQIGDIPEEAMDLDIDEEQENEEPEESLDGEPEEGLEAYAEETGQEEEIPAEESIEEAPPKEKVSLKKPFSSKEKKAGKDESSKFTRELTDHEKEQFAPFIHHKRTRKQIIETIDNISMASYTGNVVITGEEGAETIALAKLLVKEVQASDNNFSGKVAKISGSTMNKKDIGVTLSKLSGGALIIEDAADMKKEATEQLLKELNQEEKGLIVLLADTKAKMNEYLAQYPLAAEVFNLRVDLEALDDHTLVKYAKKYALEQEYTIDELGVLALHTRIADMQTSDHEVTLGEIEELIDEAIYYADRKTPAHFFDVLLGKRYDEEDMIVLREKDFMHY